MTDVNKVSQAAKDLVKKTAAIEGNKNKIDTKKEISILASALEGFCDENDKEFIQGFMITKESPEKEVKPEERYKKLQPPTNKKAPVKPQPSSEKPLPASGPAQQHNINNNWNQNNSRNHINGNGNITGNNNTVNIYNAPVEKSNGTNASSSDKKTKPLTPNETREARADGKEVAKALIGWTTDADQTLIRNIIKKEVDSRTVLEFLRGYENNSFGGNHFFKQMRTECDFDEAQNLMHKVAGDLQKYLQNKYGVNNSTANEIAVILTESTFSSKDTKALDKIVLKELEK